MSFKPANVKSNTKKVEVENNIIQSQLPKIEVTDLPSKFKPYEDKKISFTPYTFGEVNRLNQSKLSHDSKIREILKGIKCNFDPLDLTFADFLYINLLRKMSTFGEKKFNVVVECPNCGKENKVTISETDLEFDEIEVDLPITATLSNNQELVFSPLTVGNFLELLEKGLEKDLCAGLAIQVVNVAYEDAFSIVDKSFGDDSLILEEVDKILYHGLKSIHTKCVNCNTMIDANLDGGQIIIYPFRVNSFSPRNAIRFGVQKTS